MKKPVQPMLLFLGLLAALYASCTSPRERQAFAELKAAAPTASRGTPARQQENRDLPPLEEKAGLPDYLAYAALNNPGLEAAFNRWKAALLRVPQVRTLPDPKFNYGYFIEKVETRVGPQEQKIGLSQAFPWFGKLSLRSDVALRSAEAEQQRYEAEKRRLFHEVISAYCEYHYLHRSIALTRENIQLVTFIETVARTRYKTDAATHADVIKTQVELGVLGDRLQSLEDLRIPALGRLNAALGRPADALLPTPTPPPEEEVRVSSDELLTWLGQHNPDLKALDALAAAQEAATRLAKNSAYPDFSLGLQFIDTDRARIHGVRDSGKDPVMATLSLNLPIWFGKYRAREREARHRHLAALGQRENKRNRLTVALQKAQYQYRNAGRKIDLFRNTLIPKATESHRVTRQAFIAGKAGFLDLIDTERTLLAFKLALERALADRPQRLAEIEMLVGRELPRMPEETPSNTREVKP